MAKISQQDRIARLAAQVDYVFQGTLSDSFRCPISILDIDPTIAYFNTAPDYAGRYNLTVESSPVKLDGDGLAEELNFEIIFTKK